MDNSENINTSINQKPGPILAVTPACTLFAAPVPSGWRSSEPKARFLSPPTYCELPPGGGSGLACMSLTVTPSVVLGELVSPSSSLLTPLLPCRAWVGMGNPVHSWWWHVSGPWEMGQNEHTISMSFMQLNLALPSMFWAPLRECGGGVREGTA